MSSQDPVTLSNQEVAELFYRMSALLELQGANPYRIRAYQNAAQSIEHLSVPLGQLRTEELLELPTIGKDLASKLSEILLTGTFQAYEDLRKEIQPGIVALMDLQGLGPKKVKQLTSQLKIQSMSDLEQAAKQGKIHDLPGFGEKTEQNILRAIEVYRNFGRRFKLIAAEALVEPLVQYLRKVKGVDQVVAAGSYRRRKETVGDLDILVTGDPESPVMEAFTQYPLCIEVLSQGPTRSTIRLNSGIEVDLRFVEPESFGAALYYFTGSRDHNLAVRTIAKAQGLKINEYGVFRGNERVAGDTEESIFSLLGMDTIPPILRENRGEIQAAQRHQLPHLIQRKDLKGDLHDHTRASDGQNTLEEMVEAARKAGLEYIAITDHSQSTARGLDSERFREHLKAIDALQARTPDLTIFKGVEVDIRRDGHLDLPDDLLAQMDIVVASVHNYFTLPEAEQTDRLLAAIHHPLVHIIGHPSARLLLERPPIEVQWDRIFRAAAQTGTWLEINGTPSRLDLNDEHIFQARQVGCRFVISTDSHQTRQLDNLRYGIDLAQRGWLGPQEVMNTLPVEPFYQALQVKRQRQSQRYAS